VVSYQLLNVDAARSTTAGVVLSNVDGAGSTGARVVLLAQHHEIYLTFSETKNENRWKVIFIT
jgi:hypothetical protein